MKPVAETSSWTVQPDDPLVSCVCVTRDRVDMLRRAVACFMHQTYPMRELLIVYEADDAPTRDFLATLDGPMIRSLEVGTSPRLSLGALRNISIQNSRGAYVAQWDDDDWHGPTRLAEQVKSLRDSGKLGCVLWRWTMYDEITGKAYLSAGRAWEGSILAKRNRLPAYPDLGKGEDTSVIAQMIAAGGLVGLDRPQLYVYVVHAANTWERSHWLQNLLPYAQPLSPEEQSRIRTLLHA